MLIATPEDTHFEPCMLAIEAGYDVLLEKPIAQRLDECRQIAEAARRRGVIVGICHVMRYHPYFVRIKEIVDSGELGQLISINHTAAVGIDRMTHCFVRGLWRREECAQPDADLEVLPRHRLSAVACIVEMPENLVVRIAQVVSPGECPAGFGRTLHSVPRRTDMPLLGRRPLPYPA